MRQLLQGPSVRRMLTEVAGELLAHGAIPGDRVYELVAEVRVDEAVAVACGRGGSRRLREPLRS